MTLVLKILFTVFALIILSVKIHATNYYVNASTGNDSNTGLSAENRFGKTGIQTMNPT